MVDRWFGRMPPFGRGLRSGDFRELYEVAIHDVLEVLDAVGATYWATEGTLIELLRYGRNHPPETGQPVDHDVDLMIEVQRRDAWPALAAAIGEALSSRGWSIGTLMSTSVRPGARADKLRCCIRGARFARTRCDLHCYVADYSRGVAWSHGDRVSYPFQRWGGFLPLDLIHPLSSCLCYDRMAPAPHRPIDVLRDWNDGEYERPCLALPRRGVRATELSLIVGYARRLDRLGVESFASELSRCGISECE